MQQDPLIVIVGVCASGKTTLARGLRELGYQVRTFAQEHSVSRRLWQRLDPDLLIVLECSYETIRRRKRISWGRDRYGGSWPYFPMPGPTLTLL
jgi:deoxyadenosine/deoxycytidine kinase